jgi:hypothetical protein
MAWHGGRSIFSRARLGDVIRKLKRYRPGRVVIPLPRWWISGSPAVSPCPGSAGETGLDREPAECRYSLNLTPKILPPTQAGGGN